MLISDHHFETLQDMLMMYFEACYFVMPVGFRSHTLHLRGSRGGSSACSGGLDRQAMRLQQAQHGGHQAQRKRRPQCLAAARLRSAAVVGWKFRAVFRFPSGSKRCKISSAVVSVARERSSPGCAEDNPLALRWYSLALQRTGSSNATAARKVWSTFTLCFGHMQNEHNHFAKVAHAAVRKREGETTWIALRRRDGGAIVLGRADLLHAQLASCVGKCVPIN